MSFNQTNNAVLQEKKLTFTIRLVAGIYQRMNGNRKTDKRFDLGLQTSGAAGSDFCSRALQE